MHKLKQKKVKISFPEIEAGVFGDTIKQHILYPT